MACCVDIEYLLVGGRDGRTPSNGIFMWYDWMVGGWGGRNGKDGSSATSAVFGVGEAVQPLEGQERLCPVVTTEHQIATDSGGPGRFRGGCGVRKGGVLTGVRGTVMSYCCDRARSITWGIQGGLPSIPHGVWLTRAGGEPKYMGAIFSNVPVGEGDHFTRPSAGGGGMGDPLERDPEAVLEDVIDEYVSVVEPVGTIAASSRRSIANSISSRSTPKRPGPSGSASAPSASGGSARIRSRSPPASAAARSIHWI